MALNSFDINSWGEFLETPPNMLGTPPGMYPDGLISNSPTIDTTPIFNDEQIQSVMRPSTIIQPPVIQPQLSIEPQSTQSISMQNQKQFNSQNFSDSGVIENRTLLISGADAQTTEEDVIQVFNLNNNIRRIDLSNIANNVFSVEYFDLRQAIHAKMLLNGTKFRGNTITISFAPLPVILDPKKPPNNGTIVIFKLPPGITDDQIRTIFGQFGEIRQIRGTPSKSQQKFVEYFDTRAAEAALINMGGKYVMGCRVSIEFSLPGGSRRGGHKVEAHHVMSPLAQK